MKTLMYKWLFILVLSGNSMAAQRLVVEIIDANSGRNLPYVPLYFTGGQTTTNEQGIAFLSTQNLNAKDTLLVSYVGFAPQNIPISKLQEDRVNIIRLRLNNDLPMITITVPTAIHNGSISTVSPSVKKLLEVPQLAGQSDLLKSLQLLPGISGGQEGTAGLNIRGGNDSHTHLILDGIEVYNVNHIGGYVSSLPAFGVNNLTIYKGGVPSRYGGRLSGVVDVAFADGHREDSNHEIEVGVGLVSGGSKGRFSENTSYLITARLAYPLFIDRVLSSADFKRNEFGTYSTYGLGDGIAKVTQRGDWGKVSLSYFRSGDTGFNQEERNSEFNFEQFNWATSTIALNGFVTISPELNLRTSLGGSQYAYSLFGRRTAIFNGIPDGQGNTDDASTRLRDISAKARLSYDLNASVSLESGIENIHHDFGYQASGQFRNGVPKDTISSTETTNQYAFFMNARGSIGELMDYQVGVRRSGMTNPDFGEWEPRVQIGVSLPLDWSLNMGAGRQVQYVHRLRAGQTLFPNELWQIATKDRPPSSSDQLYFGFAKKITKLGLFLSVEGYLANFDQLTETNPLTVSGNSEAIDLINNLNSSGVGSSKGLELYVEANRPRYGLTLAYTLSKTDRQFPNLNDGEVFPFTFDRRHDISLSASYQLPRNWKLTGVFIYQTGRAISVPTLSTRYYNIFERINNARFPPFHLLNLGFEKTWKGKYRQHTRHRLTFSTYNTYNRQNPYYIGINPVRETVEEPLPGAPPGTLTQIRTVSVRREFVTNYLFPFIPGISYNRSIGRRNKSKSP